MTSVTIKKSDIRPMVENLSKVRTNSTLLNYTIIKVRKQLKHELKDLEESLQPTQEYSEYDKKRINLLFKFAKKDENSNQPIIKNNNVIIDEEKQDLFTKEFNKLKEENKLAVEDYQKQIDTYNSLLKEDFEVEVPKQFDLDKVPQNLSASELETLLDLHIIREDEE